MVRHVMVSDITDQRTLTKSANAVTDDTPETATVLLDSRTTARNERRRALPWSTGRNKQLGNLLPTPTTDRNRKYDSATNKSIIVLS